MRTSLLLLALLFGGCGASPLERDVAWVEDPDPPPKKAPPKETEDIRKDLSAIRCFLLHEKEVKEGRAPKGWKQPPMEEYEKAEDPCALLPGFEDPRKGREQKKAPPPPSEFEIGLAPIRRRR